MMHFDSQKSQACEDLYGEKSDYPLEDLVVREGVRRVYFSGRKRRAGYYQRRQAIVPQQLPVSQPPEIVSEQPPAYQPPEILPLTRPLAEQESSVEQKLFLERRMDAIQTIAEAAILEA
jgi:hypothetical protein